MSGLDFNDLPHFIYANRRQFLPGEHHMNRVFDEDVLIVMRKGVLRFTEDGKKIELSAGEYYLQRAGLAQSGPTPSDIPNYYFVHFKGTFSENGKLPLRGNYRPEQIEPIIEALQALGNNAPRLEYERLFYNLLSELAKHQKDESMAEQIKLFLHKNYKDKSITTQTLADHFYLSANRVRDVFKNAYDKTPKAYLIEYRLDKARDLLVSTARTTADIADHVGFEDYSVFYRDFTAKYKISPSKYRLLKAPFYFTPPPNERQ